MKSKAKSKESGGRQTTYVEVSGSRIRVHIVTGVTLRNYATKFLDGKGATVFLGIDPGLTQQTVCLIARTRKGVRKVSFLSSTTTPVKGDRSWKSRFLRIGYLSWGVETLLSALSEYVPRTDSWIGIEGYATRAKGSAVQTMAEIKQSLLQVILEKHGLARVVILQPMSWKACLVEKGGKLDKEGVTDAVCERWPSLKGLADLKDAHNYFDAYAMAYVVESLATNKHSKALDRFREREGLK